MTQQANPFVVRTPRTMAEFDRIADQYRQSLADVFDFEVSDKKRNKLYELTARALGFPNGYQQIKAYIVDSDKVKKTPYPEQWANVVVLDGFMFSDMDAMDLTTAIPEMKVLENGDFEGEADLNPEDFIELVTENQLQLLERLGVDDPADVYETLAEHYKVRRAVILMPRVDRYGVPDEVSESGFVEYMAEAFEMAIDESVFEGLSVIETGDDTPLKIKLELVKNN